ncbi:MAG TPA: hypothetical protein VND87_17160 [Stellaceae bacterium]|nr:hypothetical protein [Stellaceae bacterium]
MRTSLALVAMLSLVAGCSPYIPVKKDFGTSALAPTAETPPEFTSFNNYDPSINALVGNQMCATEYQPIEQKTSGAAPGQLQQQRGECKTHLPIVGSGTLLPPF